MALTKVDAQLLNGAVTADSSGNVGIGTASPAYKLHVYQSNSGNSEVARFYGAATYAGISTGDATTTQPNYILATGNNQTFWTAGSERMRIDSSGNIFVGGVQGYGRFVSVASDRDLYLGYNGSTKNFAVASNGQIYSQFTSITSLSDKRLKENINVLPYGLLEIQKLKPVTYNYINQANNKSYGFIAQDVKTVLPELINEDDKIKDDGISYLTLKMGDMLPVLVKAIQELKAELDATKAEVAALKAGA